jgi:hypothetical protein
MAVSKGKPIVQPDVTYASYLLRLWQVRNHARPTWVASVRSPATGDERHFPSVEALAEFLLREFCLDEGVDAGPVPGPPDSVSSITDNPMGNRGFVSSGV